MIRRFALAAGLALALALPAQAQRAGVYDVTGTNLDGTSYTGIAQIVPAGLSSFVIRWRIGNAVLEGVGFASGRTVAVAYGQAQQPGLAIYTINPDGSMDGEWTIIGASANGRERLVPRAETPTPAPTTPAPTTPAPTTTPGAPAPR